MAVTPCGEVELRRDGVTDEGNGCHLAVGAVSLYRLIVTSVTGDAAKLIQGRVLR